MRALSAGPAPVAASAGGLTAGQWAATLIFSTAAGLILVAGPAPWVAFGLLGVAALAVFGLLSPALFLALFLVVRPLLDEFSHVDAGVQSTNVAGALGLLLLGIAIGALAVRRRVTLPPTTGALVALVAVTGVTALVAVYEVGPAIGFRPYSEVVRLLALVAAFLLAATLTVSKARVQTLCALVALSAVGPAIWGIWEMIVGVPVEDGEVGRISGSFASPVTFGAFLAFTSLLMIFGPVQRLPAWVRWPALGVMLVALVGSYSRFGWFFFVVGFLILAWPARRGLVVAAAALVIALGLAVPSVRERALPVSGGAPGAAETSGGYESYDWRIANWEGLLAEWSEKPLLGWGLESTAFVNQRAPVGSENRPDGGFGAHNVAVRVLVEGGIVLLAAYIFFAVAILRRMRRLARERWDLSGTARLLYVSWTLLFVTGLTTDDPFQLTALMVAVFALTGAVEGAHRRRMSDRRSRTATAQHAERSEEGLLAGLPAGAR